MLNPNEASNKFSELAPIQLTAEQKQQLTNFRVRLEKLRDFINY